MICLRRRVAIIIDSWSRTIPPNAHTHGHRKRSCSLNKTSHLQMRFIKHVHVVYPHMYTDTYNHQLSLCLYLLSPFVLYLSLPSFLFLPLLSQRITSTQTARVHARAHAYIHITYIYIGMQGT